MSVFLGAWKDSSVATIVSSKVHIGCIFASASGMSILSSSLFRAQRFHGIDPAGALRREERRRDTTKYLYVPVMFRGREHPVPPVVRQAAFVSSVALLTPDDPSAEYYRSGLLT